MSSPNPLEVAAIPSLLAVIKALQTFNTNIGPDPTKWALTVPGAFTVLLGTVQLQVPELAIAEGGALQADVNAKLASWATSLSAKLPGAPA